MPVNRWRYPAPDDWLAISARLEGRLNPDNAVEDRVLEILRDVKQRGDEALVDYTRRFDAPAFDTAMLRVPDHALDAAAEPVLDPMAPVPPGMDERFREDLAIIAEASERIREFHQAQKERSWWTTDEEGVVLGQLVSPVDRVGLYTPGGQGGETPLISSLLMNAIPAQVAGVQEIAVVSPPRKDGSINPYILAAARLLGIDEVYAVGSAWAVAALAYGTASIPAVDVIAGPGNAYVATAKRLLIGRVGIDMVAGPSEVTVLADGVAGDPEWVAADMLSQAEHDALASSVCVTWDVAFADAVEAALQRQVEALPRSEIAAKALADWGAVVLTEDADAAVELVNKIAPEHLELMVTDPWALLGKIRHAGAIFMGGHTPEPVGDYFAGPNHVLPTNGTARFSSALSVEDFCKKSSVIATPDAYLREHGGKIARLARLEGLEAHARSVESRLK